MPSDVPAFTTSVRDGQLQSPTPVVGVPVVFGVSSAGTVATASYFANGNDALDALGLGPLTDTGMGVIRAAGGAILVKLTGSVAAANSAVTPVRVGTSVGTVSVSGAAHRDYRARVVITTGSDALGSGKFKYSLDNGNTFSDEITIPSGGTFVMPESGLTLTFALQVGTPDFQTGDVFTFTSTCAMWNATNLAAGVTALLASPLLLGRKIEMCFFTGIPDLAATAATLAAAIATHMATLQSQDHFARALHDGGSLDSTTNYLANYVAAFSDTRVEPCYGRCEMTSPAPIEGFSMGYVSCLQPSAERAAGAEISENLGRAQSGPLRGVKATTLGFDEEKQQAFTNSDKTLTLRTNRNLVGGAYITNAFLKSPSGSDFTRWDYGRTLDRACSNIVQGLAPWTLEKLRALTDGSGFLDPRDAARVKKSVDVLLSAAMAGPTKGGLPKHVTEQEFVVETNYDFITLSKLKATYRMVPTIAIEGADIVVGLTRQLEAA
jgi:hypothetical protein